MKTARLSRSDLNKLNRNNRDVATMVQSKVASKYQGVTKAPGSVTQYDLQGSAKTRIEVKHCLRDHGGEYGGRGRFRLFKEQHTALTRYDRKESAYYVFVLLEPEQQEARMIRKSPADVGRLVASRGGFNRSGHSSGPQKKLPWSVYF